MPEDKSGKALGRLGAASLIGWNAWLLNYDVICHVKYPACSYQFEAIGITATSSDTGVVQQPSVVITSS